MVPARSCLVPLGSFLYVINDICDIGRVDKKTGSRVVAATVAAGREHRMPHSPPMPSIGHRCHELRVNDQGSTWRIVYQIDTDAVVIVEVFKKYDE